ncbi:hypothetical protein CBFG_04100 [Clostridiales bacterium 1_7_47FAA]|nr:hypothetical protein CBFG_04100 [Clostridiales bacterium 1_7_47FAA]
MAMHTFYWDGFQAVLFCGFFAKIRLTKADFFYIIEKMFNYTSLNVCFHITR